MTVKFVLYALFTAFLFLPAQMDLHAQTCSSVIQDAIEVTGKSCLETGRNEACYGYLDLELVPRDDSADLVFEEPGDRINVSEIEQLKLSPYTPDEDKWGVAFMRLQANIPDSVPGIECFICFVWRFAGRTG